MAEQNRFNNIGDWLIWRSTGPLGEFKMPVCTALIALHAKEQGWYPLNETDINRILARYKDHVTYWNISVDVIKGELAAFAAAVNYAPYSYQRILEMFNRVRPMKIKDCRVILSVQNQYNGRNGYEWASALSLYLQAQYAPTGQRLIAPIPIANNELVFPNLDEDDGAWRSIKQHVEVFAMQESFEFVEEFRTVYLNPRF